MGAGCGADLYAFGDALQDGSDAKKVVGEVKRPVCGKLAWRGQARALAIHADVFSLAGNAQSGVIEAPDASESARRNMPSHAVVAEIGQWMTQGRQLPIEHREHARLGGVKDQVIQPVVAMHDGGFAFVPRTGGNVCGQPFDEAIHLLNRLNDRSLILLAPAANLALKIVARFAIGRQALRRKVNGMQSGLHAVHLAIDCAALILAHAR